MGAFFSWLGDVLKSCIDGIIGFFVSLWDLFWSILCAIGQFFVDCWNYLWDWCQYAYYCSIDWVMRQLVNFLDLLAGNIDLSLNFGDTWSVWEYIAVGNCFLPLDIILLCGGAYLQVLLVWVVYKFVKSWIPTVSGS